MICVNSVSVYPSNITINKGDWYYGAYAEICPTNATCCEVVWSSGNTNVATVNAASGAIYAKTVGTAKIYARATDGSGESDYITVTVTETVKVNSITLSSTNLTLEEGAIHSLSWTICPESAEDKSLTWGSTDKSVATVSVGTIRAISEGTTAITATANDGSGVSAICFVSVSKKEPILVSEITFNNCCVNMYPNEEFDLEAVVSPGDADNKHLAWTSSDTSVATVADGKITSIARGSAKITATATDGSGVSASCCVTVKERPLTVCINLDKSSITVKEGTGEHLEATVYPADAYQNVMWYSEDESIAIVNSIGYVVGRSEGVTRVYAEADDGSGIRAYCDVNVEAKVPVTSITLSHDSRVMDVWDAMCLDVEIFPSDATNKTVIWDTSNSNIASIDERTGRIVARSVGNAIITATTVDGAHKAQCTIKVYDRDNAYIERDDEGGYQFYKVTFSRSKRVWKSVGVEESKLNDLAYSTHSSRMELNKSKEFSDAEIAFLYKLDPLGVANYVAHRYSNEEESLSYKDRIYLDIFGEEELTRNRFYFIIDNDVPTYGNGFSYSRADGRQVYSKAEIIFGAHFYYDWSAVLPKLLKLVVDTTIDLIDPLSDVVGDIEITCAALFFASAVLNDTKTAAYDYLRLYCDYHMSEYGAGSGYRFVDNYFNWPGTVAKAVVEAVDILNEGVVVDNVHDITLCNKVSEETNYKAIFKVSGKEYPIQDIADLCIMISN